MIWIIWIPDISSIFLHIVYKPNISAASGYVLMSVMEKNKYVYMKYTIKTE